MSVPSNDTPISNAASSASSPQIASIPTSEASYCHADRLSIEPCTVASISREVKNPLMRKAFHRLLSIAQGAKGGSMFILSPKNDVGQKRLKLQQTDSGYFFQRLRRECPNQHANGLPNIYSREFLLQVNEFLNHDVSDRWPEDYEDKEARGKPKDGLFLVSLKGTVITAAARIVELMPLQYEWKNSGCRHNAALHAASTIVRGLVIVTSQNGSIHIITADSARKGFAYCLAAEDDNQESTEEGRDGFNKELQKCSSESYELKEKIEENTGSSSGTSIASRNSMSDITLPKKRTLARDDSIATTVVDTPSEAGDTQSLCFQRLAVPDMPKWQIRLGNDHQCPEPLRGTNILLPEMSEPGSPHRFKFGRGALTPFIPDSWVAQRTATSERSSRLIEFVSKRHLLIDFRRVSQMEVAAQQVEQGDSEPSKKMARKSRPACLESRIQDHASSSSATFSSSQAPVVIIPLTEAGIHILDRQSSSWQWLQKDHARQIFEGDRIAVILESPISGLVGHRGDVRANPGDTICQLWIELWRTRDDGSNTDECAYRCSSVLVNSGH
eukprot:gnl/MRDRNA2_/MRDRNA2_63806_c0_seq2.p1 gnl/MRDRNA2_/MRDRNA2_63806_c0~~gnl/MRDRNA2_/MRDRNA2_63806_c0_seq2.p1  ORF type:complete len:578 (+),score=85.27 gnl/MRDRNA2_/MRDRNA2_63806_c0_seq2:66-1736(+)